jgi:CPA2 family monovalent cation:H+ antiporter-2
MAISAPLLLELGAILLVLTVLGSAARRYGLSPIPLYLLTGLFRSGLFCCC